MSVNYSIIKSDQGNIAVQSTVESFNLNHVTNKDIVSFYSRFSQFSAWDTGLLPVEGSGILTIRTAGQYTQFAYQHKPGLYHVNWGKSEGAPAAAYYLAQPYRIIICDMKDGNLLGARMFYSPYPITNPSQQLYHVNLPNINCKGYRGNGVGWICLYQNEDWQGLPLNERIVRFIERCSGVETYNDANMSETDGTRFYRENGKPSYFWDPIEWESKSTSDGFEWTLDEDLLIPVLVESMDSQGSHKTNGVPLTLADALVGDYQAYYYDTVKTKPINAIIRPDKKIDEEEILSYFVNSYNIAGTKNNLLDNTFESSADVKNKIGSVNFTGSVLINAPKSHQDIDNHEEDEDSCYCEFCDNYYPEDDVATDYYGNIVCQNCLNEGYVYIEEVDAYFSKEDNSILFLEKNNQYYHLSYDSILECPHCSELYANHGSDNIPDVLIPIPQHDDYLVCPACIINYASEDHEDKIEVSNCHNCAKNIVVDSNIIGQHVALDVNIPVHDYTIDQIVMQKESINLCVKCSENSFLCPCGSLKTKTSEDFNPCTPVSFNSGKNYIQVNQTCASCVKFTFTDEGQMNAQFVPISMDSFFSFHNSSSEKPISVFGVSYDEPF